MGKKKMRDQFDLSVDEQLKVEKELSKYFGFENHNETELKSHYEPAKIEKEVTKYVPVKQEKRDMTEREMLSNIIGNNPHGYESDNSSISSIFDPNWDKRNKHKATNINSIIKGKKKKGKMKDLLNDMILEREDEYSLPDNVSYSDSKESENMIPGFITSGYVSVGEPVEIEYHTESASCDKMEYPISKFLFDPDTNSILVFNEEISFENNKPDVSLCLNHIMPTKFNKESDDFDRNLEDIIDETTVLMTLLRKPDYVLNHDGFERFLNHFTYIDYDLIHVFKMSTCMTEDSSDTNLSEKYLIYLYSPISNISDGSEIKELYDMISNIGNKLPGFINYLSQYLLNPLVSNINDWNNTNDFQLLTLGDHDEEEDAELLIEYLTDPEINSLYTDNELWTENSKEPKLTISKSNNIVRFDIQYIQYRINKLQKKVNDFIGLSTSESRNIVDEDIEHSVDDIEESIEIEEVKSDDLIIDKILTGENRGD